MDFIVDNYLWFIVGGIVVLMIIIGFIAEKTDFGRKPFNQNKKEKREENKKEADSEDEVVDENNEDKELVVDSELELPIEDVPVEDTMVSETEEIENDLDTPISEALPENIDDQLVPDLDVSEFSGIEEATEKDLGIVEDVVADDSEDDVWKF